MSYNQVGLVRMGKIGEQGCLHIILQKQRLETTREDSLWEVRRTVPGMKVRVISFLWRASTLHAYTPPRASNSHQPMVA
jgi:hypothetical protein